MTEQDKDREIAAAVRELAERKRTLACLVLQANRWATAIQDAAEIVAGLQASDWTADTSATLATRRGPLAADPAGDDFPSGQQLAAHVEQIAAERKAIDQLYTLLSQAGLNIRD